ncbi:MAG TPA: hypothetical protein VKV74_15880, partial [Bryobacteraceae bacterium]|nr:hypothetical protein [Bryobacteraceae bacterium]
MEPSLGIQDWLFEAIAHGLASALETIGGERPAVHWEHLTGPPEFGATEKRNLTWRQSFQFPHGAIWVAASAETLDALAKSVLAREQREIGEDSARSVCLELIKQTVTGMAKDLSARFGDEVILGPGEEV